MPADRIDDEPLPVEQKRYLEAFDGYLRAWAADDEPGMVEYSRQRAELLPAAMGKPISVVALVHHGGIRRKDGSRHIEMTLHPNLKGAR